MMETDRFDALTASLAQGLTRRRSLGLLAVLGTAATLVADAEAGKKRKKGRKKKKPCGGKCGPCEACFNNVCTPVAEGAVCGSGKCFDGQCVTCSGGKVPVDGICAKSCVVNEDCPGPNVACHTHTASTGPRYCMEGEPFGDALDCPGWNTSLCSAGYLCVNYGGSPKCLFPD